MPVYQYTARNEEGQLITETIAYRDENGLRHFLRRNNLFVLQVAERRQLKIGFRRRVRLGDLIIMTRQLRTMIQAGMPMVTGLEALAEQSANPYLAEVLSQVARSVASGRTLASSLADTPQVFPQLLITLVRSGEAAGRLPDALREASRQLELQMEIRQKVISALMYPAFTLLATIGTLIAMLVFIVPVFANIYHELNATLPAPTLLLVHISHMLVHETWIFLLVCAALLAALRRSYQAPDGRLRLDAAKLNLPLLGALFRKSASANLTGSLAGLMESGLPLIEALQTSAEVCGNEVMARSVRSAAFNITQGRRLSDELERTDQFPLMVVRMIAIAEDVGTLPEVLREISASYIEEVEYTIRRIMALIEPIMVLTVAGVVGFVLVALYYPIFNLGNVFAAGA